MTEEQFKPLRLMNGLYLQLHAYMLRVAIPYGTLSSDQMRQLAHIARRYDKGYGHFTTRQNIQYNWPRLEEVPDILAELAEVEMHAIQTSGNCIRNVTADQFAGVAAETRSKIRGSTPRSCASGPRCIRNSPSCRASSRSPITGAEPTAPRSRCTTSACIMRRNEDGEVGFEVMVGGGQGRTPIIAKTIRGFLPEAAPTELPGGDPPGLQSATAGATIKYKARIKILVHSLGVEEFAEMVEAEWAEIKDSELTLPAEEIARIEAYFAPPAYEDLPAGDPGFAAKRRDPDFARWVEVQRRRPQTAGLCHRQRLAEARSAASPGDATAAQMSGMAELAERFSLR